MPRRFTVIGAGAVGLLYGARLQAAGHAVTWVVPSSRREFETGGVHVDGGDRPVSLAEVTVVDDPAGAPPADVVLVALKTTANERLAELVGPAVAPGSTVAMFQNGMGVEEAMAEAAPQAGAVIGAMCFVCAHRLEPGRVHHLDYGFVELAQLGASTVTAEVEVLAADLESAGFEVAQLPDLRTARWRKLVWNLPFNGLSVVLDAGTDALMADPSSRALVDRIMAEVISAGRADGADIDPSFAADMVAKTLAMTPYAPSMKLDYDTGRRLELAAIYDAPIAAAAAAGSPMPTVRALRDQLAYLDARQTGAAVHA